MKSGSRFFGVLILLFATAPYADTVTVTGGDGYENGLLVDGDASNDDAYTGADGSAIPVGPYTSGPGEVIAFTVGHVPTLLTQVGWTPADDDDIDFAFDNDYAVKLTFWVVNGPFDEGNEKAINACIRAAQIWVDERQGVAFSGFAVNDATSDADASNYTDFDCSTHFGDLSTSEAIRADIGYESGALNVYLVDTVDFGGGGDSGNGCWQFGSGIHVGALGWNASDNLLAHEIGHGFDLDHVDELTSHFDETNVMWSSSSTRAYLTEGQTFRATFNSSSAINSLFGRSGLTRSCGALSTDTGDDECPAVQTRIWEDN